MSSLNLWKVLFYYKETQNTLIYVNISMIVVFVFKVTNQIIRDLKKTVFL